MGNGISDEYRKKSTILGDNDILQWSKEQKDKRKYKERQRKLRIIHKIPNDIKKKLLSGVEKEQIMKGMSILDIYKRRLGRQ